jgi:Asp-tRNA(Asn)/Glu-tRNA(Gln) amidotransferase A subunit family amidase
VSTFLILTLGNLPLALLLTLHVDDINLVHGMPVCVQIVGGRFGEEKAVAVGKVVDGLMNPTSFHS